MAWGTERNLATADRQDLRSVIWASAETWQVANRASGPWLLTAAVGLLAAGVLAFGAIIVEGASDAVGVVLTTTCVALLWTVVFCTVSGVRGRLAARKVLDRQATGAESSSTGRP